MRSIVLLCVINGSENVNVRKMSLALMLAAAGFLTTIFIGQFGNIHDILIYSANSSIELCAALKKIA